jgi:biotin carboxyl carrier protein
VRRYTIGINDTTKIVDVEAVGANEFRVQIDGRLIDVTLEDHRDLAHSAITPAMVPRAEITHGSLAGEEPVAQPAQQRPRQPADATNAPVANPTQPVDRDQMTAPMPGVILSIDVTTGAEVKRGDTLMVLEAMKMKNQLRSPRDGVVAELYVSVGTQVRFGETLLRFE